MPFSEVERLMSKENSTRYRIMYPSLYNSFSVFLGFWLSDIHLIGSYQRLGEITLMIQICWVKSLDLPIKRETGEPPVAGPGRIPQQVRPRDGVQVQGRSSQEAGGGVLLSREQLRGPCLRAREAGGAGELVGVCSVDDWHLGESQRGRWPALESLQVTRTLCNLRLSITDHPATSARFVSFLLTTSSILRILMKRNSSLWALSMTKKFWKEDKRMCI